MNHLSVIIVAVSPEWGKQLFFIYFGLPKVGLSISAEVCGAVGLGLLGGSYMAESFRSELEAVPVLQMESKRNQCVFSNQPDISCSQYGIRNFTWNHSLNENYYKISLAF